MSWFNLRCAGSSIQTDWYSIFPDVSWLAQVSALS
jgi:hypothetical protein